MKNWCFLLSVAFTFSAYAQTTLRSPEDFLSHSIGEKFTTHHQVVSYYEHVAANSPYVKLVEYGRSVENRPLIVAFVSTPENLANLENIRLNHLRKTGLVAGKADEKMNTVVTWLSFTVHGNEAAGTESALPVLYDLVNPENTQAKTWLQNSVVIIDPCLNPDGYTRYTDWYARYATAIPNPDMASVEHNEPWPNGRVNHYMFDLNRDWAWLTQKESQQRLILYNQWMPHVHADLHEMGINSPYYFAPAAAPYHEYITKWQRDFQVMVGKNNAKYFDKEGWLYFTKEVFDLFYPSYGDTYPTYNGSIGMTYEQGGSGRAGIVGEAANGDLVTLADRAAHHKAAAISTVEVAAMNATALNQNFEAYFKTAQNNPVGTYKTYIIKGATPKSKLQRLIKLLDQHFIRYGTVSSSLKVTAFDYATNSETLINVEQGDLVISAYQPKGVLTQILFEPQATLVDSLTYDITAWALPYAHGLEAYATKQRINTESPFVIKENNITNLDQPYAYAVRWQSVNDAHFLSALLQAGIKVRYATAPFGVGRENFAQGTLIINRADNRNNETAFSKTLVQLIAQHKVEAVGISTGFVDKGKDLGSDAYVFIHTPKIALIGDYPTYANDFGHVWHYLEQDLKYPLSILKMEVLSRVDINRYNTIIFPEGNYRMSESLRSKIADWVNAGGRLILIGSANEAFANQSGFSLKSKSKQEKKESEEKLEDRLITYGDSERDYVSQSTPGAVFKTIMDATHPLSAGIGTTYFTLKTSATAYAYLENAWNVGYLDHTPSLSGFVGASAKENLQQSLVFGVQQKGRGAIIYMIDHPLYRGFWEQGKLLFANALFFVGQ
jgi:hypothetical protein